MKHLLMSLLVASASMSAVAQDIQMMNAPVLSGVVAKAKPQIAANQRIISDYLETGGHGKATFNNGETMIGSFCRCKPYKKYLRQRR